MPFCKRVRPEQPNHPEEHYYIDLLATETRVDFCVEWVFERLEVLIGKGAPEHSMFHIVLCDLVVNYLDLLLESFFDLIIAQSKLAFKLCRP